MGIDYIGLILHGAGLFVCVTTFWAHAGVMENPAERRFERDLGGVERLWCTWQAGYSFPAWGGRGLSAGRCCCWGTSRVVRAIAYLRETQK